MLADSDSLAGAGTACALRDGNQALSRGELRTVATERMRVLRNHGVRPGDRVVLSSAKSVDAIAWIFGILEAGATCVPIDCRSPASRIETILADCAPRAWIEGSEVRPWKRASQTESGESAARNLDADHGCAYILYTSGSTGRPKGVCISHRAITTFVDWCVRTFALSSSDRVASFAPLHFDLSFLDVFASLRAGAQCVLVPESCRAFPSTLGTFLAEARATLWYGVPSVFRSWLRFDRSFEVALPEMSRVLSAGEVLNASLARELRRRLPGAQLFNLYGPTETNVVTCYEVDEAALSSDQPVPIGFACDYATLSLVDDRGAPLREAGRVGELVVAGPTVMDGYWPERGGLCSRAEVYGDLRPTYATGDWLSMDTNGRYRFHGRRDLLAKHRGHRIHPAEVERVLSLELGLGAACVKLRERTGGETELVAFVEGSELDEVRILRRCRDHLPSAMVPDRVVPVGRFPLTANGKIDRGALSDDQ